MALVGSDAPFALDPGRQVTRFDAAGNPPGGADPALVSPKAFPVLYAVDWPARPGRRVNTDEHLWLGFTPPLSQRAARTTNGPRLRAYFDDVFGAPPAGCARFDGPLARLADPTGRRAVRRLGLSGQYAAASNRLTHGVAGI